MSSKTTHQLPSAKDAATPAASPRISISITPHTIIFAILVVIIAIVLWYIFTRAANTIVLLFIAIIIGEGIRPLTQLLERYHIPSPLTVLLVFAAVFGILAGFLWILVNPLASEASSVSADLPRYAERAQEWVNQLRSTLSANAPLRQAITTISDSLARIAQQYIPVLLSAPLSVLAGIFTSIIDIVVVVTMTIFWLMASRQLKPFVVGLFPASLQEDASHVISEVGKGFGGYVRGTLVAMALIGLLTTLGLAILGVPYALLLGILAAFTELIPYLGPWISGTVAFLVALIAVDPLKAVEVAVLFVIIQQAEGNLVEPLVMSRAVNVDPLLVIVSVLIGIQLMGIIGAILAVPIAAGVQVVMVRVIAPTIRRAWSSSPDEAVQQSPGEEGSSHGS